MKIAMLLCVLLLAGCEEETWSQHLTKMSESVTADLQKHPGFETCSVVFFENGHINKTTVLFRCPEGSVAVVR